MLRTIHLTGKLAKFSKKPVQIDAPTTLMMMQGLFQMFGPRFKQMIRDGEWHLTRGKKLKDVTSFDDTIAEEELKFNLGSTQEIYLCPAVKAKSGIARVVVGVVLIVVGVVFQMPMLVQLGAGLALGGVAEMLAPKPTTAGAQSQASDNPSFLFNGTVNVTEQGGPAPVLYGRVPRASSLVLSAGISTENMTVATSAKGTTTTTGGRYANQIE